MPPAPYTSRTLLDRPVVGGDQGGATIRHATPYAPQVDSTHYFDHYDTEQRWSSYWLQIEEALRFDSPLLEVGVGSGLVTEYLRTHAGRTVTTVDIDPALHPDVIADVVEMPFESSTFECVMACEVLEHMPFDRSERALAELRRVGRHAIISVPDAGFCIQVRAAARGKSKIVRIELPWLFKHRRPRGAGQHFWEMNVDGYPNARIEAAINRAGWRISRQVRNPDNSYHHFFVLE